MLTVLTDINCAGNSWLVGLLFKIHISVKSRPISMKLPSNVCNRRHLVCVKFYLNRISFAVVIAKCVGGSLFWDTLYNSSVDACYVTHLISCTQNKSVTVSFPFALMHILCCSLWCIFFKFCFYCYVTTFWRIEMITISDSQFLRVCRNTLSEISLVNEPTKQANNQSINR